MKPTNRLCLSSIAVLISASWLCSGTANAALLNRGHGGLACKAYVDAKRGAEKSIAEKKAKRASDTRSNELQGLSSTIDETMIMIDSSMIRDLDNSILGMAEGIETVKGEQSNKTDAELIAAVMKSCDAHPDDQLSTILRRAYGLMK